ncbi:MAG TPA: hypothetical protein VJA25_11100 [Dehalococcoidia bacterium]|nr:hypothetical protein [Dehalococcoidia bacterium]
MSDFPYEDVSLWKRWWVALWTANTVALMSLIWMLPPKHWMVATTISFGLMEGIGLLKKQDAYPPLTFVMRRFLPRWLTHTALTAYWGAAVGVLLELPFPAWKLAVLTGILGWTQDHFDLVYER